MLKATVVEHLVEGDGNHVVAVEAPEENGPSYVADNGLYRAEFYQAGNRVVFQTQGRRVTYTPQAIRFVSEQGVEDTIYAAQEAPIEVKGPNVRFNRPFPDIDDQFTLTNDSLDHSILVQTFLREPSEALVGRVDFVTSGRLEYDADLQACTNGSPLEGTIFTQEGIELVDPQGQVIFVLPPVVAFDSGVPERASTEGRYRVTLQEPGVLLFDIAVDNEWMCSHERRYPIVIDPTVVVSTAHSTYGNNGRKMVRLSNGWLLIVAKATSTNTSAAILHWYVSKDGGATWALLTTTGTRTTVNFAMANVGTTVYTILLDSAKVDLIKFDAVTVTSTAPNSTSISSTGQTTVGTGSIAADGIGNLYCVWDGKTNTYSNNIRMAKSSDGGTTWTVYDASVTNASGINNTNPTIAISNENWPYVVHQRDDTNTGEVDHELYIFTCKNMTQDGSQLPVFDGNFSGYPVYVEGTNAMGIPSIAIDPIDQIHVVWSSAINMIGVVQTTHKSINYVMVTTWNYTQFTPSQPVQVLVSNASYDQTNPTIMADRFNRLFVLFQGRTSGSYDQLRMITCDNGLWDSTVTVLTPTTSTSTVQCPSAIWSKYELYDSLDDTLRYVYMEGSSLKSDVQFLNAAPLAPILKQKKTFDATTDQTLEWIFEDPYSDWQTSYELEIYDITTDPNPTTAVVDMAKTGSLKASYSLAANTLNNACTYKWRVKTYDSDGVESPWSDYSTFQCSKSPVAAFQPPATISSNTYTFVGSYVQESGVLQKSYQFKLWEESGTSAIKDSGVVMGKNNQYTFANLKNGGNYLIEFLVTSEDGLTGSSGVYPFHVSYTPPQLPEVSATYDPSTTLVSVAWVNAPVIVNYALNSDFQTLNSTVDVLNDPLTGLSAWTIHSGSFTTGASGATAATGSTMVYGNSSWQPKTGANGQGLAVTAQATFATGATLPANGMLAQVYLLADSAFSAYYSVAFSSNGTAVLQKKSGGQVVSLGSVGSFTAAVNSTYKATLSLDSAGTLTAKLYSVTGGATPTTTLLVTVSATDTTLQGSWLLGLGADSGIAISNAIVNAPFADSWTAAMLSDRGSLALSPDVWSGQQAVCLNPKGAQGSGGIAASLVSVTPGNAYTASVWAKGDQGGLITLRFLDATNNPVGTDVKTAYQPLAGSYARYAATATAPLGAVSLQVLLQLNAPYTGTQLLVDGVQIEQASTPSSYVRNDSITQYASDFPVVASNSLYRRKKGQTDEDWQLLGDQVSSPFIDYTCPVGEFEYGVCAVAVSGATSDKAITPVDVAISGQWLIDETNPQDGSVRFYYNSDGMSISTEDDVTYIKTFSPYLRERRGQARSRTGKLEALFLSSDGDLNAQIDLLDRMCTSEQSYLLKLSNGRILRVRPSKLEYKSQYGANGSSVSVTWMEVGLV